MALGAITGPPIDLGMAECSLKASATRRHDKEVPKPRHRTGAQKDVSVMTVRQPGCVALYETEAARDAICDRVRAGAAKQLTVSVLNLSSHICQRL